ncbi:putative bifunctional diguanylate cyclase/phosphodiesterase [Aminobacter ciceronei]|jgi:diguanylate cyclase (GGDEF)-like protein|uniref:putative bifunctional diguanylate cyclase/phosphodiesterase n=1 Tax=Aminobacter ciceronei TaxID=150723 RepID=UPI003F6E5484
MVVQSHPRPLTFQVTLTVLALAVLGLGLAAGFGLLATLQVDRAALDTERTFLVNGLKEEAEALRREQESIAVWDDAVTYAKSGDQQWMAENLGAWMHSYYGHDRVYVLDDHDQPVHAMRDGQTVASEVFSDDRNAILPLVGRVRQVLAAGSGDTAGKAAAEDLVTIGDRPAMLSVMPLVPSSDRVAQSPGSEFVHVAVQFIDDALTDRIASRYQLKNLHVLPRLTQAITDATVPLIGSHGVILGYVGWQQARPGTGLVREAAPALFGAMAISAAILIYLLRRLRRASGQLQISQDKARYLAFHDTLTGLPNRALFEDRLRRALVNADREKGRVALLYVDLDRFKHINDTLGHPAGDELVRQTAVRLVQSVREIDTVARLGGDEFAIILSGVKDARNAEDFCDIVLAQFSIPFQLADDQVFVSTSIGIALAPDVGADPDDLLRKADIALYEAKKNGRGRYQVFAGDMDEILLRKRRIESELREALTSGDQIRLTYQPIYAGDCQTILGAEALLRWTHPIHAALPPGNLVAIAEERGMIGLLGDYVLRQAARFAATSTLPWVAVNVSPLQLRDKAFPERLARLLEECGLTPSRLQLEITESVLLANNDTTRAVLAELRATGILVALDDFGTGYSAISYLRHHRIDKLKIDRSFIQTIGSDAGAAAIAKALVDLALALDIRVTAEGVETEAQKDRLIAMRCHEFQGFLLSPPLEATELSALLAGEAQPLHMVGSRD